MSQDTVPSQALLTALGDANLAAGLQYGLWVESSPSVEEQISLSSMSQDKLGHARAYYQLLDELHGLDPVSLQYDRGPDEMAWPLAWVAPLPTWSHFVLAQALFSRALLLDVQAVQEDTRPHGLVSKIEQEEAWHTRHGDAWLQDLATGHHGGEDQLEAAFEELWPLAVAYFGAQGTQRFPEDVEAGLRTRDDQALREAFLDEVVELLEGAGLTPGATRTGEGWQTDPAPTDKLVHQLEDRVSEHALELLSLLSDPEGREIAQL